jgi:hypothetical protein
MTGLYIGCNEDTTNPGGGGQTDTSAINFNDRTVLGRPNGGFDTSHSAINFYNGVVLVEIDANKDAVLVDSLSLDSNFSFRSGHLSDIPVPGYQTRFSFLYLDMTQAQFDSTTVIPDSNDSLSESDFTLDQTFGVNDNTTTHSVYGFYLKGRYDSGWSSKPVYGMLYIDKAQRVNGRFQLTIDIN